MHHLTCGISSLLHSVNLIVFTLLLAHLILRISPHHSHHLRSHHLSLTRSFTPDLKLISFTNHFLHSHCYSFRTAFTDINLYWIKWAWLSFSRHCATVWCYVYLFSFWLRVLDWAEYSAFESTSNSAIVSYGWPWFSCFSCYGVNNSMSVLFQSTHLGPLLLNYK